MTNEEFKAALVVRHGKAVYDKIINSKVAIAGLGGLGSNVAISLARAGVGEIFIVDFDCVDISNLNRQQYFIEDIGKPKTDALEQKIRAVNPIVKINKKQIMITENNAMEVFGAYPIVCECLDKAENKAMLINTLLSKNNSIKVVAASGMAGYESSNKIVTKKINDSFYICGDGVTGIEYGYSLFAPRVAICANHQANMVLRLILGMEEV